MIKLVLPRTAVCRLYKDGCKRERMVEKNGMKKSLQPSALTVGGNLGTVTRWGIWS